VQQPVFPDTTRLVVNQLHFGCRKPAKTTPNRYKIGVLAIFGLRLAGRASYLARKCGQAIQAKNLISLCFLKTVATFGHLT